MFSDLRTTESQRLSSSRDGFLLNVAHSRGWLDQLRTVMYLDQKL